MARATIAVFITTAILATAFADDPTEEERAWIAQCVERLDSPSERITLGAYQSLCEFDANAIPTMVVTTRCLKTDRAWELLERALRSFGSAHAASALDSGRERWPREAQIRLGKVVDSLRAEGLAAADPGIEKKVREEFAPFASANEFSPQNPRIRRVVALGRDAIPVLVKILREYAGDVYNGFVANAAAEALANLVRVEDLPVVARLLEDGILVAATAMRNLHCDAGRDALLVAVARGFMDWDLLNALRAYGEDERVQRALVRYLEEVGRKGGSGCGVVAEYLGEAGNFDALPVLRELVIVYDLDVRRPVATALVNLGEKDAIKVLIEIVAGGAGASGHENWQLQEAGVALNRVVGKRIFIRGAGPDSETAPNYAEAAEAFRAWWEENSEKLEYNRQWRTWKVREK